MAICDQLRWVKLEHVYNGVKVATTRPARDTNGECLRDWILVGTGSTVTYGGYVIVHANQI